MNIYIAYIDYKNSQEKNNKAIIINNSIIAGLRQTKSWSVWGPTARVWGPTTPQGGRGQTDKQTNEHTLFEYILV